MRQVRKYDVLHKLNIPRLIDLYNNSQETIEEAVGESSPETRGRVAHAILES